MAQALSRLKFQAVPLFSSQERCTPPCGAGPSPLPPCAGGFQMQQSPPCRLCLAMLWLVSQLEVLPPQRLQREGWLATVVVSALLNCCGACVLWMLALFA